MFLEKINIVLADDDIDDCNFFKEALDELPVSAHLTTVHDGEKLMQLLTKNANPLPDVLFLDLNMPRKNGFDCLVEIKRNANLKSLPVIIFSTSFEQEVANLLYKNGAQHYIRKPSHFSQLKNIIYHTLTIIRNNNFVQPSKDKFVIFSKQY